MACPGIKDFYDTADIATTAAFERRADDWGGLSKSLTVQNR